MCGICGILYADPNHYVCQEDLTRMNNVMIHRGPDDCGIYIDGNIGLASRRLSIIDRAGGHMPISNEDGSVWIVYNGELYNYLDLRNRLVKLGHSFKTRSDTEVILHAYEEFGINCLPEFRGMFAFAIWDSKKKELFGARDRLGVKPFYYSVESESFFFASEIKAILQLIKPEFNQQVLPEYLANRFVFGEDTFFKGINKLLPGHYFIWRNGQLSTKRYWDVCFEPKSKSSPDKLVKDFYQLFQESVKMRLMSEVPLGVFLSGGIDSSAIAAAMSQYVKGPIKSFSVAFEEEGANELDYARTAAKAFNTDHHEIVVSSKMFFEKLEQLIWYEDEPIAFSSSIPLYYVSELAKKHVTVVLTGEGSDELLAGYEKYRKTVFNMRLGRIYKKVIPSVLRKKLRKTIAELSGKCGLKHKLKRTFLYLDDDVETIYFDNFSVFSKEMLRELLSNTDLQKNNPYERALEYFNSDHGNFGFLDKMLYTDIKTYLERLLMKQDKMSMATSVESRVPFLDHRLVEFMAALPENVKLKGWQTKHILRKALKGKMPAPILKRKKMGFPVPLKKWFRDGTFGELEEYLAGERTTCRGYFNKAYVEKLLREHRAGLRDHSERLWLLINLEVWHRVFIDGERRPA